MTKSNDIAPVRHRSDAMTRISMIEMSCETLRTWLVVWSRDVEDFCYGAVTGRADHVTMSWMLDGRGLTIEVVGRRISAIRSSQPKTRVPAQRVSDFAREWRWLHQR